MLQTDITQSEYRGPSIDHTDTMVGGAGHVLYTCLK